MREGVTFYRSFHEAIQEEEDPAKRLQAYEALMNYAFYDEEPENLKGIAKAAFIVARPVIDAANASRDNGSKGGAPKGNQNARKNNPETTEKQLKQPPLFLENNPQNNPPCENKTSNINDNDNKNENINENIKEKKKEKKHAHGENKKVLLTEAEDARLVERYGQEMRDKAVDFLDKYLLDNPKKKYSSHKQVIDKWVVDAVKEAELRKREIKIREERLANAESKRASPATEAKIHNFNERQYNYNELEALID